MKSTKISDYFKPSKNSKIQIVKQEDTNDYSVDSTNSDFYSDTKSQAKLKLPKPLTEEQKTILKESFMRALLVKNIEFDDDLTFPNPDCPPTLNDASMEVGVQKISEYNKEIYKKFKEKTRKAEYAPIEILDDSTQV